MKTWSDDWHRWRRGEGCPMCAEGRPEANSWGPRIYSGTHTDAYLFKADIQRGFAALAWRGRHVAEPTELTADEATSFWLDLIKVGRAIETVYSAVKMNYSLTGTSVPHLHVRIVPRYESEPDAGGEYQFPPRPWAAIPGERLRQEVDALRALLA